MAISFPQLPCSPSFPSSRLCTRTPCRTSCMDMSFLSCNRKRSQSTPRHHEAAARKLAIVLPNSSIAFCLCRVSTQRVSDRTRRVIIDARVSFSAREHLVAIRRARGASLAHSCFKTTNIFGLYLADIGPAGPSAADTSIAYELGFLGNVLLQGGSCALHPLASLQPNACRSS